MKTKQYCIVEISDVNLSVETFDYTENSCNEITEKVKKWAEGNFDLDELVFDWEAPPGEAIINLHDEENECDLMVIVSI